MKHSDDKIALVLAGGGLSGAVYEMGALRAINDLLIGRTVNDFDIYVGTSAGSLVAAGLVNGLSPQLLLRSVEGSHPTIQSIERQHLFRYNTKATVKRLFKFPQTLGKTLLHYGKNPRDLNLVDLLWELSNTLPAAVYDGLALEAYIRHLLHSVAASNSFRDLEHELYVIATNLGDGGRIVFGSEQYDKVPISLAVAASTAVPLLYNPVRIGDQEYIDGGMRGTASLDVAIERGAKLVVCINPLVPYDNNGRFGDSEKQFMSDQGMQVMLDQVFRIMLHSGLHYHIKQLRRRHSDVDIILIEPSRDDALMMFSNVMRYSTRVAIARHGYQSVTLDLAEDYHYFKAILARHGIEIDRNKVVLPQLEKLRVGHNRTEVVEDVLDMAAATPPSLNPTRKLGNLLTNLEALLSNKDGG